VQAFPSGLWLSVSPAFKGYHQPVLRYLSWQSSLGLWEYHQTPDESCSLTTAVTLLHDYLKHCDRPIHLIGHGLSGVVGLLYARLHPKRVRSLTILSVAANPAMDWQSHYYTQLKLLPLNRQVLLTQLAHTLFGYQCAPIMRELVQLLEKDLNTSPSLHSLFKLGSVASGGVEVPLFVCGSRDDAIVSPHEISHWQPCLKDGDRLWYCPTGRHFFHYFNAQLVSRQILNFWTDLHNPLPQPEKQLLC
jgi:pimeloyl-ACP methyl ester carboxylesterase